MSKEVYLLGELEQMPTDVPLYAVIGSPVAHSFSPILQTAAFEACKLLARFIRIEVAPTELEQAVKKLKEMVFKGWNVTLPHKIEVMKYLDEMDDSAQKLGAVNTVLNKGGKLVGFNTDGLGWVRAIREEFSIDIRDLRIMILGIGGVGQTLGRQAALEGCERLVLVNRTFEKAHGLAKELAPFFRSQKLIGSRAVIKALPWDEKLLEEELGYIDLVVNCTSVGLNSLDSCVLTPRILQPHLLVYDTIYHPVKTAFLKNAEAVGARTANGLSMLVHQGALAFEIWTGLDAPVDLMRKASKGVK